MFWGASVVVMRTYRKPHKPPWSFPSVPCLFTSSYQRSHVTLSVFSPENDDKGCLFLWVVVRIKCGFVHAMYICTLLRSQDSGFAKELVLWLLKSGFKSWFPALQTCVAAAEYLISINSLWISISSSVKGRVPIIAITQDCCDDPVRSCAVFCHRVIAP